MQTKLFNIPASKPDKKPVKKSEKKKITIELIRFTNRKYYLHYRCKKLGIKINKKEKVLSASEDILQKRWSKELQTKYSYNLQISIV